MIVSFGISPRPPVPVTDAPVPLVSEAEVAGWLAANRTAGQDGDLEGWLRIATADGAAEAVLFDTLGPLIQYVCVLTPTRLLSVAAHTVSLYSVDAEYTFTIEGEDVVMAGPAAPDGLRVPRKLLLPALADCALRYVAALRPIESRNEDLAPHLDSTEAGARRCLDALAETGVIERAVPA